MYVQYVDTFMSIVVKGWSAAPGKATFCLSSHEGSRGAGGGGSGCCCSRHASRLKAARACSKAAWMGQPPRSCAARLRARPIFCVARLARAGHIAHTLSTAALLDKRGQSNGRRGRVVKAILEAGALSDALSSAGYSECIPVIVY